MKKIISLTSLLLAAALLAVTASASVLSPALNVIAKNYAMTVSGINGEDVVFTKDMFCDAAGSDAIESVKILGLPAESDGSLYLYDAQIQKNQVIPASDIENMKFVPSSFAVSPSFSFTFDGGYEMTCNIVYDGKVNNAPTVGKDSTVRTYRSTVCKGTLNAEDRDGDALRYEIVEYPVSGTLTVDESNGSFTYRPTDNTVTEKIVYRAVDSKGAYSEKACVTVSVMNNTSGIVFSDMENNASATAAIAMADKGVMEYTDGEKGEKTFSPDSSVSRLDFLISCMNLFGAENFPKVESTGFADDEVIPDEYKGMVYAARKLGIVKGVEKENELFFCPDRAVTWSEAAVILNNVIGYEPANADNASWSSAAVCAMRELGVFGYESDIGTLTKSETADILYSVSCMIYE